jgi:MFS family permease
LTTDLARPSSYRWVLLALAWMTQVAVNISTLIMPSLAPQIIPGLNLNAETYHLAITAQLILPIFLSPFAGGMGDRFGVKRVIGAGMAVVALAGIARIWAQDFSLMLVMMLIIGAATSFVQPNVPKLVGVWFPARQVGLATGVYVSGQAIGMAVGLMSGPLFGRWQDALLVMGCIVTGMTLLWFIFGRSYPPGTPIVKVPVMAGLVRGLKSRSMWMLSIGQFLLIGAFMAFSGNMPRALVAIHGMPAAEAAFVTSLTSWSVLAGTFILPVISDRVGRRKPFLIILPLVCAAGWTAAWFLAPGPWTAAMIFLGGFAIGGGFIPILFTLPLELPEIGHAYVGGAAGMLNTASNLGGVLIATLAMAPLVESGTAQAFTNGFILVGGLAAAIALPMVFVKETGWKGKKG